MLLLLGLAFLVAISLRSGQLAGGATSGSQTPAADGREAVVAALQERMRARTGAAVEGEVDADKAGGGASRVHPQASAGVAATFSCRRYCRCDARLLAWQNERSCARVTVLPTAGAASRSCCFGSRPGAG
jgi:hypothetical protein